MRTVRWPFVVAGFLAALAAGPARTALRAGVPQAAAPDARLDRLLDLTKDYCGRLEQAALDFVCVEEIREELFKVPDVTDDADIPDARGGVWGLTPTRPRHRIVHDYLYDYQFVRMGDRKVENRTLVKEDGIPKDERNARLTTMSVRVENVLFGPVGLLGKARQPEFDYRIADEKSEAGEKVLLVDAVPKPAFADARCNGRIWILEKDASIVRIEWEQTSVGNYQALRETARLLDAEPSLVSVTVYDIVKNGVRFPSRDTTEEFYLRKNGKTFLRSRTTIAYKGYKFFTVETDVKY
jgi:hypothetical protein